MTAATDASPPPARPVECPLCGYDQTGTLDTFRAATSSPLRGRCTECGLDWFWGDLLHPMRRLPRWFAENPARSAFVALPLTWRRALRPRRFWSDLQLHFPINAARLALFALAALLLTYLFAGAIAAWAEHRSGGAFTVAGVLVPRNERIALAAIFPISMGRSYSPFGPFSLLALLWFLFMPLPFLVLRQSFSRLRIRRAHLARISSYSFAPLSLLVLTVAPLCWAAAWLQVSMYSYTGATQQWMWRIGRWLDQAEWAYLLLIGLWLALFWSRAAALYLRLPHRRAVVALMLLSSFLAALAIAAYFPGSRLAEHIGISFFAW